jgi:spore coat protein CotF
MLQQVSITPNEMLQLHELLMIKNLSLTKSVVMSPLIGDPTLKSLLKNSAASCDGHIREILNYMKQSIAGQNARMSAENRGGAL